MDGGMLEMASLMSSSMFSGSVENGSIPDKLRHQDWISLSPLPTLEEYTTTLNY